MLHTEYLSRGRTILILSICYFIYFFFIRFFSPLFYLFALLLFLLLVDSLAFPTHEP